MNSLDIKDLDYKAIGQRVKAEAQRNGLSNEDMRVILHYANVKSVSQIYGGKIKISDDRIRTLVDLWNVRENYLYCIDNMRTIDDVYAAADYNPDVRAHKSILAYFASLGFQLEPVLVVEVKGTKEKILSQCADAALKPYINKIGLETIEKFRKKECTDKDEFLLNVELTDLPFKDLNGLNELTKDTWHEFYEYDADISKKYESERKEIGTQPRFNISKSKKMGVYIFQDKEKNISEREQYEKNHIVNNIKGDLYYRLTVNGNFLGYKSLALIDDLFKLVDGVCNTVLVSQLARRTPSKDSELYAIHNTLFDYSIKPIDL